MKKLSILFLVLMIAVVTYAQRGQHRMDLEQLKSELNLSDEQVQELEASKAAAKAKMEAIKNDESLDHKAKWEAMKALKMNQRESLKEVLTETQLQQLKSNREAKREAFKAKKEAYRAKKKETHQAIKSYKEANIKPAMQQKRLEFDKGISKEDKIEIEKLRLIAADVKAELKAKKKAHLEKRKAQKGDGKKRHKGKRQHHKKSHKKGQVFLEQLKIKDEVAYNSAIALADKYGEAIDELHASMEEQRKGWHEDMKNIKMDKISEEAKAKLEERAAKRKEKMKKRQPTAEQLQSKRLGFLLMPLESNLGARNLNVPKLKAYPNPASNRNTLEFEVRQSGNVKIDLFSIDGQFIKTVLDENLNQGDHKVEVDLSGLNNKMYYYNISDQTGTYTKKIVVK